MKNLLANKRTILVFVIAFAALGAIILLITQAATPSFSVEPEKGQVTGGAAVVNDTTASDGRAIAFASAAPPPPGECKPTEAPPAGAPPATPRPCRYGLAGGPSGTWTLDWVDEFNTNSLDINNWRPNWLTNSDTAISKPSNGSMQNCEDPRQVSVSGGRLRLTLVQRPCTDNQGTNYTYASGLVTSAAEQKGVISGSFYVETHMYMPPANNNPLRCANWPGIWTNGVEISGTIEWPMFLESDIMECLSGGGAVATVHGGPSKGNDAYKRTIGDLDDLGPNQKHSGWHVFGASLVRSSRSCPVSGQVSAILTYYYDGTQIGDPYDICYRNTGQFIILQNDIQANSQKNTLPSTVEFDYVRVWKR